MEDWTSRNKESQDVSSSNGRGDGNVPRQKKSPFVKIALVLLIGVAVCTGIFIRYLKHEGSNNVDKYLFNRMGKESVKSDESGVVTGNSENDLNLKDIHLYTDSKSLQEGKNLFDVNCVACHKADGGGGIGPNHTDKYWINGGGFDNIYHTISEGGRPGKGMVPWKTSFKPVEMAKLASYVISLNGTSPAEPKDPEGDIIWTKDME